MSQDDDFKRLAQKIYLLYHQDGLIDIIMGLSIMGLGAWYLISLPLLGMLVWMPFILYVPFKNLITIRHLGIVKFSRPRRSGALAMGILVVLGVVLAVVILLGAMGLAGLLPSGLAAFFGAPILILILATALILAIIIVGLSVRRGTNLQLGPARVYVYACIYVMVIVADIGFHLDNGGVVMAIGAIILISGVVRLVRFLRKYPLTKVEAPDVQS